ncbi:MAG: hypothetical protein HWD59_08260 [Coxiellaceae bacterium]|nr:MAG: hypothetical protein HWD59_08260 [Coxiellaceae bacterium]
MKHAKHSKTEFSSNGQQEFSASIINIWKNLAKTTTQVLGEPPCGFTLLGTGSFSHQSCGLFSDIEGALLIANEKYRNHPYFFDWITLLQFHVNSLGDAWRLIGNEKYRQDYALMAKILNILPMNKKNYYKPLRHWLNGSVMANFRGI